MIASVSRPLSTDRMTCSCPGRKLSTSNTFRIVRLSSAFVIIDCAQEQPECRGEPECGLHPEIRRGTMRTTLLVCVATMAFGCSDTRSTQGGIDNSASQGTLKTAESTAGAGSNPTVALVGCLQGPSREAAGTAGVGARTSVPEASAPQRAPTEHFRL